MDSSPASPGTRARPGHTVRPEGARASGLRLRTAGGQDHPAHAARGVILSAGAISSPRPLTLSGVGYSSMICLISFRSYVHRHPLPAARFPASVRACTPSRIR
ncbi:GMC family oxidoreductase N-terminal domain-containing protein [Streptosporangium sp. G11]|uniref:GMC family oxidoreductase N-terminal domain-containing protein n=1 Tax=Streptosporangium sp. G11 TaxID=3436926 RepID=UPI003EB8E8EE